MTRQEEYESWMDVWNDAYHGDTRLTCREATAEMVNVFPELRRVRGFVFLTENGEQLPGGYPHWWCVMAGGPIIDPTKAQFEGFDIVYKELDESLGEPIGKCMNCGTLVQAEDVLESGASCLCSRKCAEQFATSMGV